jgi:aldehyde:ferredoxin oxidoreductase
MLLPEYGINSVPKDAQSKIETSVIQQNLCAFIDSAGLCKFGVFGVIDFNHIAEVYNAVTGKHENKDTILKIGERIWYLERELNLKLGLKPEDDALPERFIKEPVKDGPMKDQTFPIEMYLSEFYKTREINPSTGKPSLKRIRELHLDI